MNRRVRGIEGREGGRVDRKVREIEGREGNVHPIACHHNLIRSLHPPQTLLTLGRKKICSLEEKTHDCVVVGTYFC